MAEFTIIELTSKNGLFDQADFSVDYLEVTDDYGFSETSSNIIFEEVSNFIPDDILHMNWQEYAKKTSHAHADKIAMKVINNLKSYPEGTCFSPLLISYQKKVTQFITKDYDSKPITSFY